MKKHWFKALCLFVLAGVVHMAILDNTRAVMLYAWSHGEFVFFIGGMIGGTSWYYVPGLLCYWFATNKGYMEWVKFIVLNVVGVSILTKLIFGSFSILVIGLMAVIVGLVNDFILCKLVGVRVSKHEEFTMETYTNLEDN